MVKFYYILSTFRVVGGMIKVFMELSSKNWAIHSPLVSDSDYWARPIWPYTEHELILENIPLYIRPCTKTKTKYMIMMSMKFFTSVHDSWIHDSWVRNSGLCIEVNYGLYIYSRGKKLKSLLLCPQLPLSQ